MNEWIAHSRFVRHSEIQTMNAHIFFECNSNYWRTEKSAITRGDVAKFSIPLKEKQNAHTHTTTLWTNWNVSDEFVHVFSFKCSSIAPNNYCRLLPAFASTPRSHDISRLKGMRTRVEWRVPFIAEIRYRTKQEKKNNISQTLVWTFCWPIGQCTLNSIAQNEYENVSFCCVMLSSDSRST